MGRVKFDENDNSVFVILEQENDDVNMRDLSSGVISIMEPENLLKWNNVQPFIYQNKKGIRIESFLSENKLAGSQGEKVFADFLNNNNIPFLYVGQNFWDITFSNVYKENDKIIMRPDFLVNILDLGNVFFDVKCRRKISLADKNGRRNNYFYIKKDELYGLLHLREKLLIPVWLAFIDREALEKVNNYRDKGIKESRVGFYVVSIAMVEKMFKEIGEDVENKIYYYRIPKELLTYVNSKEKFFESFVCELQFDIHSAAYELKTNYDFCFVEIKKKGASFGKKKNMSRDLISKIQSETGLLKEEIEYVLGEIEKERKKR